MKNVRTLISQNNKLLSEILFDQKYFNPYLSAVNEAYSALEMGELTNDIFRELADHGTAIVAAKYRTGLEKELDKAGIKNPILRKVALSESEEPVSKLQVALDKLRNLAPPYPIIAREVLSLEFISFHNGSFLVSDSDQEQILERFCRVYLENDEEKEFHQELTVLKNALEVYLTKVNSLDTGIFHSNINGLDDFFSIQGNDVSILPSGIRWALNAARIRNEADAKRREREQKAEEVRAEYQRKHTAGLLPEQIAYRASIEKLEIIY